MILGDDHPTDVDLLPSICAVRYAEICEPAVRIAGSVPLEVTPPLTERVAAADSIVDP